MELRTLYVRKDYSTDRSPLTTEMIDIEFKQAIKDVDSVMSTIFLCNNLSLFTGPGELTKLIYSSEWDNLFWTRDGFSVERSKVASEYKDLLLSVDVRKNPKKLLSYMVGLCERCYPLLDEQAKKLFLKKCKKVYRSYRVPDLELRQFCLADAIANGVPNHYQKAIFGAMFTKYNSNLLAFKHCSQQFSRRRAPRSHHRVAVSVRGGDSGDDDSGESDPPAPPLSRYGCPYLSVTCNPQPITIVSCGPYIPCAYGRRSFCVDFWRCVA